MTKEHKYGIVPEELKAVLDVLGYVDLGLPSGTVWKKQNEEGFFCKYDEVKSKFKNNLPTTDQIFELKNKCTWTWKDNGYIVVGPNGNSIFLPAAGCGTGDEKRRQVGSIGKYWSSKPNSSEAAWLSFSSTVVGVYNRIIPYDTCSVRLVSTRSIIQRAYENLKKL